MISKIEQSWIDTVFLALVIWREARGETVIGQRGVAYSILNRVEKPSWWGNDIQSVLFKKWQYSSITDPKDPQLTKWPASHNEAWQHCFMVAVDVISHSVENPVIGADSYFDISIPNPKWATADKFVKQIGRIKFYNIDGDKNENLVKSNL